MFLKKNSFKLGVLLGLLTPFLVFFIIYFIRFSRYSMDELFAVMATEDRIITFFGVWCLVGNIALFTVYTNTNRHQTAKGIFLITVIYGIGVLLLKTLN